MLPFRAVRFPAHPHSCLSTCLLFPLLSLMPPFFCSCMEAIIVTLPRPACILVRGNEQCTKKPLKNS
ncbi:hypothetical protein XELAEV_18035563mg [Xenopus laevis]|uniref:Secreted protein n=1 Tax=Xenopus laevis TaxID=8355 RepID=A0A974CGI1_XENLA|nr:hypothetical protein XELAEV_18035563mg [Xenopus laevis]